MICHGRKIKRPIKLNRPALRLPFDLRQGNGFPLRKAVSLLRPDPRAIRNRIVRQRRMNVQITEIRGFKRMTRRTALAYLRIN